MKMIKDLGSLKPKPTSNYTKRYALYSCPLCKKEFKTIVADVKRGKVTKCRSCAATLSKTTHGDSNTPLFNLWSAIKQRCYDKNASNYKWYGGAGITVCDEWLNSYVSFKEWAMLNGWKEGLELDKDILCEKLKISPKTYSPETCMFLSRRENLDEMNNRLRSVCGTVTSI